MVSRRQLVGAGPDIAGALQHFKTGAGNRELYPALGLVAGDIGQHLAVGHQPFPAGGIQVLRQVREKQQGPPAAAADDGICLSTSIRNDQNGSSMVLSSRTMGWAGLSLGIFHPTSWAVSAIMTGFTGSDRVKRYTSNRDTRPSLRQIARRLYSPSLWGARGRR